ncbi:MAG: hypothetical protein ABIG68_10430, partial [Acidobacteriota bacterium]
MLFSWESPLLLYLPVLLLAAWLVAEWLRRRRLRAFGSPAILGIRPPWIRKVSALLLTLLAVGAAAAAARSGMDKDIDVTSRDAPVILLVDAGGSGDRREITAAVRRILPAAEPHPVAVYASGQPPAKLVPATLDRDGLHMLLEQRAPGLPPPPAGMMRRSLIELRAGWEATGGTQGFIIVSSREPEEMVRELQALPGLMPRMVLVAAAVQPAGSFAIHDPLQGWRWDLEPDQVPPFLAETEPSAA